MSSQSNCIQLPTVQLPTIGGGLTLPTFSFQFSGDFNLCCHIKLFNIPPFNIGGIPILASAFAAINANILTINAYLDALDLLGIACPLD